jgi:hypothetical protein
MNRISPILQRYIIAVDVGWQEDLGVPGKPLARGKIRDQSRRTIRLPDVDDGALVLGEGGAEEARSALVSSLGLVRRRGRRRLV